MNLDLNKTTEQLADMLIEMHRPHSAGFMQSGYNKDYNATKSALITVEVALEVCPINGTSFKDNIKLNNVKQILTQKLK